MGKAKRVKAIHAAEGQKRYTWTPGANRVQRRANGQIRGHHRLRDNKVEAHWLPVALARKQFEANAAKMGVTWDEAERLK